MPCYTSQPLSSARKPTPPARPPRPRPGVVQPGEAEALDQFSGQVALVSNGSRGIGAAIVRMLAASGLGCHVQTRRCGIWADAIAPAACGASSRADTMSVWPAEPPAAAAPRTRLTEAIAIRRFTSALAVAARVAFLMSEAAAELTGTLLELPAGF